MEFKAKAQFTRISPQKARLVLDLIKGKRVEDALSTLQFTKKRIAPAIFQAGAFGGGERELPERRKRVGCGRG